MTRLRVDRRLGLLLGGVLLASFVALGAAVALPASDPALTGKAKQLSRLETRGMEIYRNEGCWYCHTQYVRETTVDKQLGRPRDPADYAGRSPAMLGYERIGGDLPGGLAGDRAVTAKSLRESHSFAYLSSADLRALVAYLFSLR